MTGLSPAEWIKLAIFYASYLYFPAAPAAVWLAVRSAGLMRWGALGFLVAISCLAYGRFVEPRILITAEHDISLDRCFEDAGAARIAVFSDTHLGLFANAMALDKITARVNALAPDAVLIAGDFIYFLDPKRYEQAFAALNDIAAPAYGVLGNHDLGLPGPDFSQDLQASLPGLGIQLVDDRSGEVVLSGDRIELVGLSDDWAERQDLSLLEGSSPLPRIVLTHNAASVLNFTAAMESDLIISGHTHGGQINLPLITCWMTGMCGKQRLGLSRARESYPHRVRPSTGEPQRLDESQNDALIFTTSGTGMVGLPMRFRVPPRIDVLRVSWGACDADPAG